MSAYVPTICAYKPPDAFLYAIPVELPPSKITPCDVAVGKISLIIERSSYGVTPPERELRVEDVPLYNCVSAKTVNKTMFSLTAEPPI